jgi:hypothetical protein
MREVIQLIDRDGNYRSLLSLHNKMTDFKSVKRTNAIVYSPNELETALKYYEMRGIDVIIETTKVVTSKEI